MSAFLYMNKLDNGADALIVGEAADIEEYLRQLEQARMLEYRGQYCRDVLVDEMLSLARKSMERNGRWIDIQVRQYERGTIEEEDLVRLLYCLLETVPKTGGSVELILNASAKQLFISLKAERFALSRGLFTSMQRILRKYKGTISLEKSGAQKETLVILQKLDRSE